MSNDVAVKRDALRHFIGHAKEQLQQLLCRLGWNEESMQQSHCRTSATDSVQANQLPEMFINSAKHSVQLDTAKLQELLGIDNKAASMTTANTFDELQANYSAKQKLQIYEHVINSTPRHSYSFENNAQFAELVAITKKAQKNHRRHRQSKPTLNEEIHLLVELQMQALREQYQLQYKPKERLMEEQSQNCKQAEQTRRRDSLDRDQEHGRHQKGRVHDSRKLSRSRERHKSNTHSSRPRSRSPHRKRKRKRRSRSRSRSPSYRDRHRKKSN